MKKIILTGAFLSFTMFSAQLNSLYNSGLGLPQDNTIFNKVKDANSEKTMSYDEINGNPYFDKAFTPAQMAENYESALARYNTFDDRIEFKKDDKVFFLPIEEKFNRVYFTYSKKTFVYIDTKDDNKGYFLLLADGNYSLIQKHKTKFINSVSASNSYAQDKPAYFKTLEPVNYIKTPQGSIKIKDQKSFLKEYNDTNKDQVVNFIKDNKIKFNSQQDLIKLVNFLNQK